MNKDNIKFDPPTNLQVNDIVWVRWLHYRHGDTPESATPTRVTKIYDDGNILHKKQGYDGQEFAWAKDVIAKSNSMPYHRMTYRTISLADIRESMYNARVSAGDVVVTAKAY